MVSQEGRAVAMAPSPSYLPTALPKSVHSRATHDGEGAVATANPQMQSEIANSQLPTIRRHLHLSTSTRLRPFPTTARAPSLRHYPLPNYPLPTKSKNRKFPTTHYPLSTTNYHLHLYTSTRPFFKSLNAPILKCNRKSEIAYCVRIGECGIIRARFCN